MAAAYARFWATDWGFDGCVANVLAEDNGINVLTGDDLLVIVTDFRVLTARET